MRKILRLCTFLSATACENDTEADATETQPIQGAASDARDCAVMSLPQASATCRGAADEASCTAAGDAQLPCFACVWTDWVPTSVDADGVCSYGPIAGTCVAERIDGVDGCIEVLSPCTGDDIVHRTEGGGVQLLVAPYCVPPVETRCELDADGSVRAGPPECACACDDPAFPGL